MKIKEDGEVLTLSCLFNAINYIEMLCCVKHTSVCVLRPYNFLFGLILVLFKNICAHHSC